MSDENPSAAQHKPAETQDPAPQQPPHDEQPQKKADEDSPAPPVEQPPKPKEEEEVEKQAQEEPVKTQVVVPVNPQPEEPKPVELKPVEPKPVEQKSEEIEEQPQNQQPPAQVDAVKQESVTVQENTADVNKRPEMPAYLNSLPVKTSDERKWQKADLQAVNMGNYSYRRAGYEDALIMKRFEDIPTAYHGFLRAAKKYPESNCYGSRSIDPKTQKPGPYVWKKYKEIYTMVKNVAAGLRKLGVNPYEHIGIYSKNRYEWQMVAESCHVQSMVSIALYDTLGEDSSEYIMNHGEIVVLFCSGETLPKAAKIVPKSQFLKFVVCFDTIEEKMKEQFAQFSPKLMHISELIKIGAENPVEDVVPETDDLSTIMYTSGTTGIPKGVMLTHRNIIAAASGIAHGLFLVTEKDCLISYLPLAHIFERVAEFMVLHHGGSIGFWMGDIRTLKDDIAELKPTIFTVVPRVLDKMYQKIYGDVMALTGLKKFLFESAYAAKKEAQKKNTQTPIYDFLVFSKFKSGLGGKLRGIISGGAPLRKEVQEFMRTCFDVPICQGYGLTETTAVGTCQLPYDLEGENIGPPLPSCELKVVDVPDMNYLTTDKPPRGEVCIRGPNVSIGYYKEAKKTAEVFDEDGWFHTGDVGQVNPNGTFSIIDRIKNIFKLAQGEYVAAEKLELGIAQAKYVSQLWIYGDSKQTNVVSVVVVDPQTVMPLATELGISGELETVIKDPKIVSAVHESIKAHCKQMKFLPYECPARIHLIDKEFALLDACTPSMKLKRSDLQKMFKKEIDQMYSQIVAELAAKEK